MGYSPWGCKRFRHDLVTKQQQQKGLKEDAFGEQLFFSKSTDLARQAPLSMGLLRQEYWNGLPFPSPGDLPNPGIKLQESPVWQADSLPLSHQGNPIQGSTM